MYLPIPTANYWYVIKYLFHAHCTNDTYIDSIPIKDFDQSNVLQWAYTHRLPLFWESEIYYGYRLGRLLFNPSSEGISSVHDCTVIYCMVH